MEESRGTSGLVVAGILVAVLLCGGALFFTRARQARDEEAEAVMKAERETQAAAAARERQDKLRAEQAAKAAANHGAEPDAAGTLQRLAQENDRLKERVAALEKELAAARDGSPLPGPPKDPAAETRSGEELTALFREVAKGGLMALHSKGKDLGELVKSLKAMGPAGLALLSEWLASEDTDERFLAAMMMDPSQGGMADPAHVPALVKALSGDESDLVRRMASHALAVAHNKDSLDALLNAMAGDKDWGVRVNSGYGVAKAGDPRGLEAMMTAYKNPDIGQYKLAVLGGLMDVAAPSTAPFFRDILDHDTDMTALLYSIQAVQSMKDQGSLDSLKNLIFNAKDNSIKGAAKKAYNEISGSDVYK